MHRMWSLQISPSLGQFTFNNSPDDDATELDLLPAFEIGGAPRISNHDFISFRDDVFDADVNIGESLECRSQVLLGTVRSRRQAGWDVGPVLLIVRSEVSIRGGKILTVYEILEMAADESLNVF